MTRTSSRCSRPARPAACCSSRCAMCPAATWQPAPPVRAAAAGPGGGDHLAGGLGAGRRACGRAGAPRCQAGEHAAGRAAGAARSRVPVGLRAEQGRRVVGRADRDRPVPGDAGLLSPEQIAGRRVDGRADQYALGCAAFELLTGAPPFRSRGSHSRDVRAASAPAAAADVPAAGPAARRGPGPGPGPGQGTRRPLPELPGIRGRPARRVRPRPLRRRAAAPRPGRPGWPSRPIQPPAPPPPPARAAVPPQP